MELKAKMAANWISLLDLKDYRLPMDQNKKVGGSIDSIYQSALSFEGAQLCRNK